MRDATIAAIATARGEAALAIVRVSGSRAISVADAVFHGSSSLAEVPSHTVWFGTAKDCDGRVLDEVVATVFRSPRSATGEDIVEISCHGGEAAPQSILQALLEAGAEPAEPGEFTRRAFVNGKMDLAQAEAVMDLIHSRSAAAQRVAARQLRGRLKERLSVMRASLLEVLALVELELDFSEEDVQFADRERIVFMIGKLREVVRQLLESGAAAEKVRSGIRVVIAGRPNAGKSTLLNALLGHDRVIVSDRPGTTRDAVEAELRLGGLVLNLVDTAGQRETADEIEREGVARAQAEMRSGDVVLYVFDAGEGLSREDLDSVEAIRAGSPDVAVVLVANKADLIEGAGELPPPDAIVISARDARSNSEALEPLLETLQMVLPPALRNFEASEGMVNARHMAHLIRADDALNRVNDALEADYGGELLSVDLRSALEEIGAITGEISTEDVLGEIFGRFCIGK